MKSLTGIVTVGISVGAGLPHVVVRHVRRVWHVWHVRHVRDVRHVRHMRGVRRAGRGRLLARRAGARRAARVVAYTAHTRTLTALNLALAALR